jgi:hypothetical protein
MLLKVLKTLLNKIQLIIISYKTISTRKKKFKKRIESLRKLNLYHAYPIKEKKPIVKHYNLWRPSYKLYFDLFYSTTGIASPNFIPIPVYLLYVEPKLNNPSFSAKIADKNFYDQYFTKLKTPKTYLRKINNFYYDQTYNRVNLTEDSLRKILNMSNRFILKPSIDSGSGKKIELFYQNENEFISQNNTLSLSLLSNYTDFVLQEVVNQHHFFKKFNPTSNNTIRILTYRSVNSDDVFILHRILRIGKKGGFLDHDNLGGIAIGINENHKLHKYALDSNGQKYKTYNNIIFDKINEEIPGIHKIESISKEIASKFHYTRFLAIDFTVDREGKPLLLEINTKGNGTGQYQMNNGPLFGKFTKEILDYCIDK